MTILNLLSSDDNFQGFKGYRLFNLCTKVTKNSNEIELTDVSKDNINFIIKNISKNDKKIILLFYGRDKGKKFMSEHQELVKELKKALENGKIYISTDNNQFHHIAYSGGIRKATKNDEKDLW